MSSPEISTSPATSLHAPLTPPPPSRPLIPRSQPPRPQHVNAPHSSPAVPVNAQRNMSVPPLVHRAPSAPSSSTALLTTGPGLSTAGSSNGSSSRGRLVTPTSSTAIPVSTSQHPLQKPGAVEGGGGGGRSTTSSTTSVNGLLSATHPIASSSSSSSSAGPSIPPANATYPHTPTTHHNSSSAVGQTSVVQTPQTGASKMAAAAKRGLDGVPSASAIGLAKMMEEEEDHPLSEKSLKARDYQTIHTLNRLFHLPTRWRLIRPLGQGAYGLVINVHDTFSGEPVAVKCITRVFDKVILARRALREITLLRHFGGHENLTGLIDLDNVWEGYNEIYLYMEPMEADLHQIVRSGQALSNSHIQYFLYQLLRGMKYIHTANVIHRDLKPGNLLVNSDCELKICDFGLARGFRPVTGEMDQNDEMKLTEYVATRWYRAPEVMLSNRRYTTAIDVWSIGCILAELLGGKPIFKGKDYVDQLNLILETLGTPDDETLAKVGSEKACAYIKTLPHYEKQEYSDLFPDADPEAVDLLSKLLTFDPAVRIDVIAALSHPYLAAYHDESDEPSCPEIFGKWEQVESLTTIEELKEAITREIAEYRDEVRAVDPEDYDEDEGEWDSGQELDDTITFESPMPDGDLLGQDLPVPAPTSTSPSQLRAVIHDPSLSPTNSVIPLRSPSGQSPSKAQAIPASSGPRSAGTKGSLTRDASPASPYTALSEDSFGNPFGGSGRLSRRTSGMSMSMSSSATGRRPNSFLFSPFGAGMTPLAPATTTTNAPAPATATGPEAKSSPMEGGREGRESRRSSGHWSQAVNGTGRRSRAPSQSGGMGLLIRQLSMADFKGDTRIAKDEEDEGEEVPPMTVSPSDAPPSAVPKDFE
ncbi:hypothetical protein CI109_104087 [Kwoniella shandongensis]|uniref:Mitogen-activated protein kinase n=1 Tax=Kwoniella shandongensis TaxID=1734106 RepID=A0A5M6C2M1_9TREE|nr:uncharacterized protein CI109_004027 [Kwoniella shandongensis]KAA5527489.1 hypothetical protein CI109_004027 [Kwoniella shandongensis]